MNNILILVRLRRSIRSILRLYLSAYINISYLLSY